MSPPIIFRPLGYHTLAPVQVKEAPALIGALRAFLTATRLSCAIDQYRVRTHQDHDIRVIRLRENQPLIEGFMAYDGVTFRGRRKLKRLTPEIAELTNIAQMAKLILPSLDTATREEHITKLLSLNGQLRPLLLEWKSAAQIARYKGAQICWVASGAKSAPEFIAKVGKVEFDVECKRPTAMVTQRLGDSEADELAATIMRCARERGLHGRMTLEISDDVVTKIGGLAEDIAASLLDHLQAGPVDVKLANGVRLYGILGPTTNQWVHRDRWLVDVRRWQERIPNARAYSSGKADGPMVSSALTLMLTAPQKRADEISKDLWERKFKKAAKQCTGDRGAIIVFEWESILDPTIFRDAQVFSSMAASTFTEFPHVARIVMRCDNGPESHHGLIYFDAKVYTVENSKTNYPDVAQFMRIEAPLERQ